MTFGWGLVLASVGFTVYGLVQMNKDRSLSLLSGGTPNQIDWNRSFIVHLLIYAAVPLLTLLGVQFPAPLRGILSWIMSIFAPAPQA